MVKKDHASSNHENTGLDALISDKMDFKTKIATKHKEGHFIMIKESHH